jgi:peptidoglycan-associated lipoprotein
MTTRRSLWSGALIVLLMLAGCAKNVPVTPEPAASAPADAPPTQTEEEVARRRQQELQASIEERERRAAEESMRRQFEGQSQGGQEEFLSRDVHFAFDSYTLSEEAKAILEQKATWLSTQADVAVQIEGHADERGTIAYNLALGERRANTVKQYLTTLGVGSDRLSTISYGEEFPVDTGHNEGAWAKNRRAHFAIIKQ